MESVQSVRKGTSGSTMDRVLDQPPPWLLLEDKQEVSRGTLPAVTALIKMVRERWKCKRKVVRFYKLPLFLLAPTSYLAISRWRRISFWRRDLRQMRKKKELQKRKKDASSVRNPRFFTFLFVSLSTKNSSVIKFF